MKIYLFLENKLLNFSIPQKISGSFSFDENPEEESKLINIEAQDNNWIIYSTSDSSVMVDNNEAEKLLLQADHYYILKRNNINYLIYVTNYFDDTLITYSYGDNLNMIIGNDKECNICIQNSILDGIVACVKKQDNNIILGKKSNTNIYVNNKVVSQQYYTLRIGDELNIYGFKCIFYNGMLLLNNPMGIVKYNLNSIGINIKNLTVGDSPQDIEVKDTDLYTKEQYFSKSPRLRRIINTKEIQLSPPPKPAGEEQMPLLLTVGPMLTMGVAALVTFINTFSKITSGESTVKQLLPQLLSSGAMLVSMLLWPTLTRIFNKKLKKRKQNELVEKYSKYLSEKKQ